MVYRVYVEKKAALANDAKALLSDIRLLLGIENLSSLRLINRYDVENIEKDLFDYAVKTVFSEPQLDMTFSELPVSADETVFAVEYLPGEFDQRADSAAQCIQIISHGERPAVRSAKIYVLGGKLSEDEISKIKKYVINPVESREASLETYETLAAEYALPEKVETLDGFCKMDEAALADFLSQRGLAMDLDDLKFCQSYFCSEKRDPTITEIKMIDTYWSDHCRHTTFLTTIDSVEFEDELLKSAYERYVATR